MPLKSGRAGIGKNIKELSEKRPHKQAVAIALDFARKQGLKVGAPSASKQRDAIKRKLKN